MQRNRKCKVQWASHPLSILADDESLPDKSHNRTIAVAGHKRGCGQIVGYGSVRCLGGDDSLNKHRATDARPRYLLPSPANRVKKRWCKIAVFLPNSQ